MDINEIKLFLNNYLKKEKLIIKKKDIILNMKFLDYYDNIIYILSNKINLEILFISDFENFNERIIKKVFNNFEEFDYNLIYLIESFELFKKIANNLELENTNSNFVNLKKNFDNKINHFININIILKKTILNIIKNKATDQENLDQMQQCFKEINNLNNLFFKK